MSRARGAVLAAVLLLAGVGVLEAKSITGPTGTTRIGGTPGQINISTDAGTRWKTITGDITINQAGAASVVSASPVTITTGLPGQVLLATDAGSAWQTMSGAAAITQAGLVTLTNGAPGQVLLATDAGTAWTSLSGDITITQAGAAELVCGLPGYIPISTDGGMAWVAMTGDVAINQAGLASVTNVSESVITPGSPGDILVTNIGSVATWVTMVGDVSMASTGTTTIANGTPGQVLLATDAGVGWRMLAGDVTVNQGGATELVCGLPGYLPISTDGGMAWVALSGAITVDQAGLTRFANGLPGQIPISTDAGWGWTSITGDVALTQAGLTTVNSVALAAIANGLPGQVAIGGDAGLAYRTISGDGVLDQAGVLTTDGLCRTDGGDCPSIHADNVAPGLPGQVLVATDAGTVWQTVSGMLGITQAGLATITVAAPGTVGQVLQVADAGLVWSTAVGPAGPQGDPGPAGAAGATGPTGPAGSDSLWQSVDGGMYSPVGVGIGRTPSNHAYDLGALVTESTPNCASDIPTGVGYGVGNISLANPTACVMYDEFAAPSGGTHGLVFSTTRGTWASKTDSNDGDESMYITGRHGTGVSPSNFNWKNHATLVYGVADVSPNSGFINFRTTSGGDTLTERFRINSDARISLGLLANGLSNDALRIADVYADRTFQSGGIHIGKSPATNAYIARPTCDHPMIWSADDTTQVAVETCAYYDGAWNWTKAGARYTASVPPCAADVDVGLSTYAKSADVISVCLCIKTGSGTYSLAALGAGDCT